jgi:hypothetical protein
MLPTGLTLEAQCNSYCLKQQWCRDVNGVQSLSSDTHGKLTANCYVDHSFRCINDIGDDIKSKLRVFADASLLFLGLDCTDDCNQLQKDLDKLVNWAWEWQMKFNASKCYVLRITNKKKPVLHSYTMHDQILENVDQKPYLGVQHAQMGYTHQQHIN